MCQFQKNIIISFVAFGLILLALGSWFLGLGSLLAGFLTLLVGNDDEIEF